MNESSPRPTAQDDAWVARLIAWADEFQIPEKDLPRERDALLALQALDLRRVASWFWLLLKNDEQPNHNDSPPPQITWLPPEIGQLQQLLELRLSDNRLSTLPPEIGQLRQLQELEIGGNQLSALPPEIGQLQQLLWCKLQRNQLTTLPPQIGQLQRLRHLELWDNQLTALPEEITHLQRLEYLDIERNPGLQLTPAQEKFLKGIKEVER